MANKAEKIATQAEKALRKDVNSTTPLPYQILSQESGGLPPQSALRGHVDGRVQIRQIQLGGLLQQVKNITPYCYVYFALQQPRPFELQVWIWNPGLVTWLHRLAYAVPLARPVRGAVSMRDPKAARFAGDPELAAYLNSNPQVLKQAEAVAVTEREESSGYPRLIDRRLDIEPAANGSLLILHTLPKTLMLRETLLANETLQLASAIEAML
jgi:hypothetical protein